jgi:hypothetical protein
MEVFLMTNETITSDGLRQSDRVSFRMPVRYPGLPPLERPRSDIAETLLVSRNGGVCGGWTRN